MILVGIKCVFMYEYVYFSKVHDVDMLDIHSFIHGTAEFPKLCSNILFWKSVCINVSNAVYSSFLGDLQNTLLYS